MAYRWWVLERKNPADENADFWAAFNQLQAYKEDIPDLFVANALLVKSHNEAQGQCVFSDVAMANWCLVLAATTEAGIGKIAGSLTAATNGRSHLAKEGFAGSSAFRACWVPVSRLNRT